MPSSPSTSRTKANWFRVFSRDRLKRRPLLLMKQFYEGEQMDERLLEGAFVIGLIEAIEAELVTIRGKMREHLKSLGIEVLGR